MTRDNPTAEIDSELSAALRSLLLDIEDMYEGAEISPDSGDEEEYFGPFSTGKIDGVEIGDVRISWPNLAISVRKVREALRKVEKAPSSDSNQPPERTAP